jgi:hypothetical protein
MNIDDVKRAIRGMFEPELDELDAAVEELTTDISLSFYLSGSAAERLNILHSNIKTKLSKLRSKLPTIQEG